MSRIARNQMETTFFHNMTQGINKEYIFEENRCKKKYIELLQKEAEALDINLIAFTIMDNHAHILLYTENINHMSLFMKKINGKFAMYYNYINERVGIVFRNRYKSQPILSEKQLINCIRYIFNNPVKAKIVFSPEQYIYSNFKDFQVSHISEISLDKIYKNINHLSDFQNTKNQNIMIETDFLDTFEDTEIIIKELIKTYKKENEVALGKNTEEMKKIVQYVKKNINVSHKHLADILQISKTTVSRYMKEE